MTTTENTGTTAVFGLVDVTDGASPEPAPAW